MHYRPRLGPRFWRMWSATGISAIGDGMVYVGFPLLALHFTKNAVLIAAVAVVAQVPALLVAIPAGALADRLNRRQMLVAIEFTRFVVLGVFAGLILARKDSLAALYAVSFLLGVGRFAYKAAITATLPDLIPEELLVKGNSRIWSVTLTGEDVAGEAVGGFAFALSRFLPFAVDSVSFLFSAVLLNQALPNNKPVRPESASLLADVRAGIRWFTRNELLRLIAAVIAVFAFCQAMVFAVLVLYVTQDLHVSKATYGVLLSIAAVASAIGAIAAPHLHRRLGSGWCILVAGIAAAGAYAIMAVTSSPVAGTAAMSLETVAVTVGAVASVSLRQSTTPAELQGRVASAHQTVVYGVVPLGSLLGGVLASHLGIRTSYYIAGATQAAAIALAAPRLLSRIRQATVSPAAADPLRADLGGVDGEQRELIVTGRTVDGVLELPGASDRAHQGGIEPGDGGVDGLGAVAEHP